VAGLIVTPVDVLSDEQLARVAAIYEDAFRPDLRVPFSDLIQSGTVDRTFVATDGDSPAGVAAVRLLGSVQWSFLRYFAVAAERRSHGLGRHFCQVLRESLAAGGWPARLIFEVEDPAEAGGDKAERVIRERRISFWTACGARLLPVSAYVLPDYTGSGMTEPVLLMAAASAAGTDVRGDRLRELVLAIYTDRYGMAPDDGMVTRALASIAT
jgi:GNAT superfamily N-acetyltransferase